jgi:hypothetical protein
MNNEQTTPGFSTGSPQNFPTSVPTRSNNRLPIILSIIFAVAFGAGVYLWMNNQAEKLKADKIVLQEEITNLQNESKISTVETIPESQTDQESSNSQTSGKVSPTVLAPGSATYGDSGAGRKIVFDCFQEPGTLTSIWVRYGKTPDSLQETSKFSNELGLGEAGTFIGYPVVTSASNLESGNNYFYQCAATKDGMTIYSDMAIFTSEK